MNSEKLSEPMQLASHQKCRRPGRTPHVFASIFSLTYGFSGKTSQAMSECIHQILATNRHSRPAPFELEAAQLFVDIQS
jgi:hypothetical protein